MFSRNEQLVQERQSAIAGLNSYIILRARGQRGGLSSSKLKLQKAYTEKNKILLKHDYEILKILLSHLKVTLN
jgi:hypothetical protein